jgi:inorganic pyrophosphatase
MDRPPIEKIEPYDGKKHQWRVVIETPKGGHNKYKFDEKMGVFVLGGVLPEGMRFPYDFGYLPKTLGDDGDPLDVLLLMDAPAFCGCVVPCRLIGVIEAKQTEDGSTERNDRLVAVPVESRVYREFTSLKDLNTQRLNEIEEFFVSYNRVRGKKFKVLRVAGPKRAQKLADNGIAVFVRSQLKG